MKRTLLLIILVLLPVIAHGQVSSSTARRLAPSTFANLGTPANGSVRYCSNCQATSPCTSGGAGANASRVNGVWNCSGGGVPSNVLDDSVAYCADAGASDTYACSLSPAPASYVTGARYRFKANTANTGAATINLNSLGAKTIKKVSGGITTDLADNDIRVGQVVELTYDGTNMQMQSTLGNAGGGGLSGLTTGQYLVATSATTASTDGVKRYVALLTQSGTDAPAAVELENSLGGTVVWTRNSIGNYSGTLVGAFTSHTVFPSPLLGGTTNGDMANGTYRTVEPDTVDAIRVITADGGASSDDLLNGHQVVIYVYP